MCSENVCFCLIGGVFQPTIDGIRMLVPVAALPRPVFSFSSVSYQTILDCAHPFNHVTSIFLASLFLLLLTEDIRNSFFFSLSIENLGCCTKLLPDLQNLGNGIYCAENLYCSYEELPSFLMLPFFQELEVYIHLNC